MDEQITPTQRLMMAQWVIGLLGVDKARLWWQTENPMLGGVKPYQMTLQPLTERKLYRFIENAYENRGGALSASGGE